jgi:uncharacterized protein (DUF1778 family)
MPAVLGRVEKTRNTRLEARVSGDQKSYFQQAADLAGRTLSEFVINSTQDAAAKVMAANEAMMLSRQEQAAFVTGLLKPAEPGARLRLAAKRYRQAAGL